MRPRSRVLLVLVAAASALLLVPVAAGADSGGDHDAALLRGSLVGSTPTAQGGPTLFGVKPGGVPWVIGDSRVRVSRDGELEVRVEGLVIPALGTAGPVTTIMATLVCNGVPGTPTATSPLSQAGNGRIEAMVTVPMPCLAPAVLVNPNGNAAAYIAANG